MQPCDFESRQAPEGHARIEVRSASLAKLRGHFGEAAHDRSYAGCGHEITERARATQMGGDNRGKPEDAAADDGVDHQRRKAPASDRPYQVCWFACAHFSRLSRAEYRAGELLLRGAHALADKQRRPSSRARAACSRAAVIDFGEIEIALWIHAHSVHVP